MLPEKLLEVLKKDGVVAIATLGPDGPHMVNTWNSYIRITQDERLLIPAGYMHRTEANIAANSHVLITLGSSKVEINRMRVDLPPPLGPSTPKISPSPTSKETWSTATT